MGSKSKKTATKPLTDRQPMCDKNILRLLADQKGRSITEMTTHFHVTQTAIRQRLIRLAGTQLVTRKCDDTKRRSRPQYLYYITTGAAKEEIA